MIYEYVCTHCGWKGDRLVTRVADADEQFCRQPMDKHDKPVPSAFDSVAWSCGKRLVREEIPLTGAAPGQWAEWRQKK